LIPFAAECGLPVRERKARQRLEGGVHRIARAKNNAAFKIGKSDRAVGPAFFGIFANNFFDAFDDVTSPRESFRTSIGEESIA